MMTLKIILKELKLRKSRVTFIKNYIILKIQLKTHMPNQKNRKKEIKNQRVKIEFVPANSMSISKAIRLLTKTHLVARHLWKISLYA